MVAVGDLPSRGQHRFPNYVAGINGDSGKLGGNLRRCNPTSEVTSISVVDLNLIGEVPSELSQLVRLSFIDLRSNSLTREITSESGNLSDLQVPNLSDNRLTGQIPSELGSLPNPECDSRLALRFFPKTTHLTRVSDRVGMGSLTS